MSLALTRMVGPTHIYIPGEEKEKNSGPCRSLSIMVCPLEKHRVRDVRNKRYARSAGKKKNWWYKKDQKVDQKEKGEK